MKVKEKKVKYIADGTIVTPKGFQAAGVHAGLRYTKKDLGVIVCDVPATCAAVYTQNVFQAAPLQVTKQSIAVEQKLQAVIVNSAYANACTGEQGLQDAYEMRKLCAETFGLHEHLVAVASTGVIGEYLPMEKIRASIPKLKPKAEWDSAVDFQTAILTTDLVMKKTCYETVVDGQVVTIAGAAKGSGMIHPNMATMLAFITTDANIPSDVLQDALRSITNVSFNQITVDGETSTNDMVIVMASGLAGNETLSPQHPDWENFYEALRQTCEHLAKQIARDGEGATKLIEARVKGARTDEEAKWAAKHIVGSNLVKTAVYGADANWGRIIGAIGHSGAYIKPDCVDVWIGFIQMLKQSQPVPFSEEEAKAALMEDVVVITVDLHLGEGEGIAWGCDLTYDYIKINASYRT
ncbi:MULTISPECIES: bifunctional ornithine acetyltransferase/N-acetylglutamate synthase [Anoxybacillus]|uniref:Arginine biosynthesis bifunctional protein ArgJ n=1 Tax=Anoxybacillus flavithermus TaxID=33934 RepID=A0A178TGK6_9BACL|nr:bifunctional ornithine acetyltransferase/N-acetylglutamate synthase [Anoxybacillus flavithermus]ASA96589.1 bifunctional ornithine acetyltransferase/N-acetylglutamate synthase [Anoxybacillus flavithermus]ELK21089.1 bifunctional ornithine acetyltransferase/N-acetylglutamate synthase [Anoxybacillus flavithermus TNO-09.006]MBE2904210.1 bifunctional ornithine acetyltransferase/N-acetylglutamate synthase [Anoxybacillus flavithermus]MBE2906934.1 bifunctional ornithine acetyltransferase/N-acetylglut